MLTKINNYGLFIQNGTADNTVYTLWTNVLALQDIAYVGNPQTEKIVTPLD